MNLITVVSLAAFSLLSISVKVDSNVFQSQGNKTKPRICTRDVYSVLVPNKEWGDIHDYHTQVWYHTLDDIHALWSEGYFDYVLDIRPPKDINNPPDFLEGWESFHIPGSFPIDVYPSDTPASEVEMLVPFDESNICKDSRIFLHCWSGFSANKVAKTLIELNFTNVHAAGPVKAAGIWDWKEAGYELVYNDTFDAEALQPDCLVQHLEQCEG